MKIKMKKKVNKKSCFNYYQQVKIVVFYFWILKLSLIEKLIDKDSKYPSSLSDAFKFV